MTATINYNGVPNLEALLKQTTDEEIIEKANAYKTLAPGVYRLKATKIDGDLASERAPIPGRFEFNIRWEASDRETGQRKGSFFARLSPEKHFMDTSDGKKLDKSAKLWGQAAKALGMEKESVDAIINGIANYPFEGYVSEYFMTADRTGPLFPRNPDERKELVELGATPSNSLSNLSKVK